MKKLKRIFSLVPPFVLWLMLSVLVWGFVFTRITDTDPLHKLTLWADAAVPDPTALAARLEEGMGDRIKMVQVRPFTYAMFDGAALEGADLFLIPASHMETYGEWFSPLPEEMEGAGDRYLMDGLPVGVKVYDGRTQTGAAAVYIDYAAPDTAGEDFFLAFGKASLHNPQAEDAADALALSFAQILLEIE